MLYFDFQNYEGFKERFDLVEHGNGTKSRRNKILLAFIKSQSLLKECRESGDYKLINLKNLVELQNTLMQKIQFSSTHMRLPYKVELLNYTFKSAVYATDDNKGLCEDGDPNCVRYINMENNQRVFKMKAGKMIRSLILESKFGKTLPEQVLVYLMEQFTINWQSYTIGKLPQNTLHVDSNFGAIYDSCQCVGNFHSCMVDVEYHDFYSNSVDAKAAYLTNEDGKIIARCIIYTECTDQNGKVWRLAERQYATDESLVLKKALIDQLIQKGYIDGYKKIGADCHSSRMFLDNQGNSLENLKFKINCDLEMDDHVSYQDSFKYYHYNRKEAYNYESCSWDYDLAITSGYLEDDNNDDEYWDAYHGYDCDSVTTVFLHGRETTCDSDNLADFVWVDDLAEYHHHDDIVDCPICGKTFVNGYHSYLTDEDYCCSECQKRAEKKYKEANWYYSTFEDAYFENQEDIVYYMEWNNSAYVLRTISRDMAKRLLSEHTFHIIGKTLYHQINKATGMPYFEIAA